MKFFIFLGAVLLSGCGLVYQQAPGGSIYTRALDGVEVPILNNYAPCLDIEASDGQRVDCLRLGQTVTIRSNKAPLGPDMLIVNVVGRTMNGTTYLGAGSQGFRFRRGEREVYRTWVIDYLDAPREIRSSR